MFILLITTLVLIFGARLFWQQVWPGTKQEVTPADIRRAVDMLESGASFMGAAKALFNDSDLRYCLRTMPRDIARFIFERRRIALSWLWDMQRQIAYLMAIHIKLAQCLKDRPSPSYELDVRLRYARFLAVSWYVLVVIWLRGPYSCTGTIYQLLAGMAELRTITSTRLMHVELEQATLSSIHP